MTCQWCVIVSTHLKIVLIIRQKSGVDFNSTSFFKSEGFNVYCLVVSSIAWLFEFFTCGSILLALRQDRMHGPVNCGRLLRQPKRTFHPVWKVCIVRRISPARNFDAFYIFTIKFSKSPARNFQTFQSGFPLWILHNFIFSCTLDK
jgi:hypothetical protein